MSVGLPSVCLSVPAVQEQKVCTASVDRQTHHNSLIQSQLMPWEEGRTGYRDGDQKSGNMDMNRHMQTDLNENTERWWERFVMIMVLMKWG